MSKGHAFSLDCIIEFGATMTLLNALGWIILSKCSLLASTSRADVDYSHFTLPCILIHQTDLLPCHIFLRLHLQNPPVYSSVAAFLRAMGHLAFHEVARFLSEELCGVPLHVTYPTHAILVCLLSALNDLVWPGAKTPWLVLFVQS